MNKPAKKLQKFLAYGKAWSNEEGRWTYLKVAFEAESRCCASSAMGGAIKREAERLGLTSYVAHYVLPFPRMH